MLIRFWRDDRAATAIEYCLVAGLISIVIVTAVGTIGTKLAADYYGKAAASFN